MTKAKNIIASTPNKKNNMFKETIINNIYEKKRTLN